MLKEKQESEEGGGTEREKEKSLLKRRTSWLFERSEDEIAKSRRTKEGNGKLVIFTKTHEDERQQDRQGNNTQSCRKRRKKRERERWKGKRMDK